MVQFTATIRKFGANGDKSGWTYIEVPAGVASVIKPGCKKSFRVKGKLDKHTIEKTSILPVGEGNFILPVNKSIRNAIKKATGATIIVSLTEDRTEIELDPDLMACLEEEREAKQLFMSLAPSHQRYFSKWVGEAKTEATKAKRIARTIDAMLTNKTFGEAMKSKV